MGLLLRNFPKKRDLRNKKRELRLAVFSPKIPNFKENHGNFTKKRDLHLRPNTTAFASKSLRKGLRLDPLFPLKRPPAGPYLQVKASNMLAMLSKALLCIALAAILGRNHQEWPSAQQWPYC